MPKITDLTPILAETANTYFIGEQAGNLVKFPLTIVKGTNGIDGADGIDGAGVPAGGTAGQILSKIDGADYNTEWVNNAGGGSAIEYGTWTPSLIADNSAYATLSTASGFYTKNDRLISVDFNIILSSKGSMSGGLYITGLPFRINTATTYVATGYCNVWGASGLTSGAISLYCEGSSGDVTYVSILVNGTTGVLGRLLDSQISATTRINGSRLYICAA
jgi:hypothetical protein